MKSISIFKSISEIIIYPNSITNQGVGIASNPIIKIKFPFDPFEIYDATILALASVKFNIEHPLDWKKNKLEYEKKMGYTQTKFHKNFKYCLIEYDDIFLYITPSKNLGNKMGFELLSDKKIIIDAHSNPSILFINLTHIFELCK